MGASEIDKANRCPLPAIVPPEVARTKSRREAPCAGIRHTHPGLIFYAVPLGPSLQRPGSDFHVLSDVRLSRITPAGRCCAICFS